jgi:hypothetical protein
MGGEQVPMVNAVLPRTELTCRREMVYMNWTVPPFLGHFAGLELSLVGQLYPQAIPPPVGMSCRMSIISSLPQTLLVVSWT